MVPDALRFSLRTAGFVGLTMSLLAGLETDRVVSTAAEQDQVLYTWMQRYGLGLLKLYGLEVTAKGPHVETPGGRYPAKDAEGKGRVFVMNHRSMFDIFVNLAFLEANIMSRADLARWPVIGLAARRVGTLFVDRSSKRSGAAAIHAVCSAVEKGRGVMVYPEGTTFAGDEVHPFRAGAFAAAQRSGAEVVPVGIAYAGSSTAFLDEPFAVHLKRVASAPKTRIGLAIGEAIEAPHDDVDALRDRCHADVQRLTHEARKLLG